MAKKNLSQIAKKTVAPTKQVEKPVATEIIPIKVITTPNKDDDRKLSEEERDLKAKETIKSLLSDVVIPEIGVKILEPDGLVGIDNSALINSDEQEHSSENEIEWFNEQIIVLNNTIDELKKENYRLSQAVNIDNSDSNMNEINSNIAQSAIALFNEIQDVYDNLERTGGKLRIQPIPFLLKLTEFFPFLKPYRRQLIGE